MRKDLLTMRNYLLSNMHGRKLNAPDLESTAQSREMARAPPRIHGAATVVDRERALHRRA